MKNQELQNEIDNLNNIERKNNIFNNPVTKTLLSALGIVPVVGSIVESGIDSGLNAYLKKEEEDRLLLICEKIVSDHNITSDMVKDVKEIISFAKMLDVSRKLITNDKLDYLVRLYKNLVIQDEKKYNEYEEYLRRLDELSFREIEILHILDEQDLVIEDLKVYAQDKAGIFDEKAHHIKVKTIEEKWVKFQNVIQQEFGIDSLDLQGYMLSISRSGFCIQFNGFQMPIRSNSIYAVTKYYRKFANSIYK